MKLLRSGAVISGFTLGSRILGGLRDIVLAGTIGAGPIMDAFVTAQMFPNLFRRVFAEGAFSQAFVPIFSRRAESEGEDAARRLASETFSVLLAVTAGLTIVAQLAMPLIMLVLQGGYRDDPDIFRLSVVLTQITMPYLAFMSISALLAGVLNAYGRFALAAFAPTFLNLSILVAALSVSEPRHAAYACAVAITIAGVLQTGLLWWGCRAKGLTFRLRMPRLTPDVKRVVSIALPGAFAASAVQINILISQALASHEVGAKSYLNYADRLYQLPLGLIGVAVGVAVLPSLSRAIEADDAAAGGKTMDEALGLSLGLTLPAAAALLAIPVLLIDSLFARGAFTGADARMSGLALLHYAWGVPAFVLVKVLAPAFYARHDTMRPMRFAMVAVVVNIAVGAGLFFWLSSRGVPGFPGLAIGTSVASWINVALLFATLVKDGWYRPGVELVRRMAGALGASAILAGVLLALASQFDAIRDLFGSKLIAILAVAALGGLVYLAAAIALGVIRRGELRALLRRRRA